MPSFYTKKGEYNTMLNFAVSLSFFSRFLNMRTLLAFQICRFPRNGGDRPVVSDTLVKRSEVSPPLVGFHGTERRK